MAEKKQIEEETNFQNAIHRLGNILSKQTMDVDIPTEGNTLYRACDVIGQAMKMKIVSLTPHPKDLEEVCQNSGLHYRKIALSEKWWTQNQGHLLGYLVENNQPVALIHTGAPHYDIIDPVTQKRVPVDKEISQKLSPIAYIFYRPLPKDSTSLWTLLRFGLRGTRREYVSLVTAGILAIVVGFLFPLANKVLFDNVITTYNMSLFFQVILGLLVATFSIAILNFTRSFMVLRLDGLLKNRLQIGLWDRLLKLPVDFFRKIPSGDLVRRTFIFEQIRQVFNQGALRVLLNGLFSVVYLLMMCVFSWRLALIGFSMAFLGIFITTVFVIILQKYQRKLLASNAVIYAFLTQVVNGISKLRIASAEKRVFAKWAQEFDQNQRLSYKIRTLQTQSATINAVLEIMSQIFVIGTVIWMIYIQLTSEPAGALPMTLGTFLAFNAAYSPFSAAIFDAADVLITLVTLIPFWERVKPIFEAEIEKSEEKLDPGELQGHIRVEHLKFRYDEKGAFVLDGISMEIKPGQLIGIAGPTGCGKSTLCRLLIGFESPESGAVYYDNKDLAGLDPYKVRMQIGTILQNTAIFSGSIYDNIVCGGHYSPEELIQATKLSTFDEDLAELPMGFDTIMPPGGGILSGGQRQRLLLTRALIQQPKILILDEAMSMLDNRTQDRVAHNLESLKATQIVVAHRLSTIRHADCIYVIDKGKIIASGTFDELANTCTLFASLLEKQKL